MGGKGMSGSSDLSQLKRMIPGSESSDRSRSMESIKGNQDWYNKDTMMVREQTPREGVPNLTGTYKQKSYLNPQTNLSSGKYQMQKTGNEPESYGPIPNTKNSTYPSSIIERSLLSDEEDVALGGDGFVDWT